VVWIDQRGSEVLTRNECARLLAVGAGGVGRVGLVESGNVVIEPVNYRMLEGDVLIQIGPGSMLEAARRGTIVSFEVDELSVVEGRAWSVLVHGLARLLGADEQPESARPAAAAPPVPEPGTSFVRIRTGVVSGRRFLLHDELPAAGLPTATDEPGAEGSRILDRGGARTADPGGS